MLGMEMMMKSLGLDAEKITATFDQIGKHVKEQVELSRAIHEQNKRIEAKLDALLARDEIPHHATGLITIGENVNRNHDHD